METPYWCGLFLSSEKSLTEPGPWLAEAYDILAPALPVYGWWTEGFDTAYLKDAKALLGELA